MSTVRLARAAEACARSARWCRAEEGLGQPSPALAPLGTGVASVASSYMVGSIEPGLARESKTIEWVGADE